MPDLRRKILDASVRLVAERGVRGVSFREVARRAGVSHQAPYHEFDNHLGILRAIGEEGFGLLADDMERGAEQAGSDALARLAAAGRAYVRFARAHLGHFRVMFQRDLVDIHAGDRSMPEAERAFAVLVRLADGARAAGHGRGLGTDAIVHLCWSSAHGAAILVVEGVLRASDDGPDEAALAESVVANLTHLLAAGPPVS